jgi:hypothetical protein
MKKSILYLLFFILPFSLLSQDESNKEEEDKKNGLAVFLGATSNKDATVFAIGLDYQYRINKVFGVGAVADYASGDIESLLIGPALFLHAWHFEFTVAPTIEFSGGDIAYPVRFGAGYEFELPHSVSITLAVFFDTERNEESALVYGLSFGFKL